MRELDKNRLKYENDRVLDLVQAMLGAVTANFRAVSLSITDRNIILTFVLFEDTEEDREEIDDIVFEFEALQPQFIANDLQLHIVEVDFVIIVDKSPLSEINLPGRKIFIRKENG
jgi:hypothetical protein